MSLARAWTEYAADCKVLGPLPVPSDIGSRLVMVAEDEQLRYGYVPVSVGPFTFSMFFMTIKGGGDHI